MQKKKKFSQINFFKEKKKHFFYIHIDPLFKCYKLFSLYINLIYRIVQAVPCKTSFTNIGVPVGDGRGGKKID